MVVEYKSGDDERYATKRYDDALRQLDLIGSCFASRLGFRPVAIYAYGARFSYELIDPGSAAVEFDLDLISSVLDPSERS